MPILLSPSLPAATGESQAATWISLFRLYDNLPSLSPDWYKALREDGQPQTGNNAVDASIKLAYQQHIH